MIHTGIVDVEGLIKANKIVIGKLAGKKKEALSIIISNSTKESQAKPLFLTFKTL
jgi:hypothetical protein